MTFQGVTLADALVSQPSVDPILEFCDFVSTEKNHDLVVLTLLKTIHSQSQQSQEIEVKDVEYSKKDNLHSYLK